jgi:dTDP-4-dehydrorhamnose 3,5-epimerase
MKFTPTPIAGACIVELEPFSDERGFFARGWCQNEFREHGLAHNVAQANISFNRNKHTLRGFHYQVEPNQEDKLLRCTAGSVHDVLIDLRPDSATYMQYFSTTLSRSNYQMILVPKGCANAFLTLEDDTEVTYLVSEFYAPQSERGVRWNDPAFAIKWPEKPAVISQKDQSWPDFQA